MCWFSPCHHFIHCFIHSLQIWCTESPTWYVQIFHIWLWWVTMLDASILHQKRLYAILHFLGLITSLLWFCFRNSKFAFNKKCCLPVTHQAKIHLEKKKCYLHIRLTDHWKEIRMHDHNITLVVFKQLKQDTINLVALTIYHLCMMRLKLGLEIICCLQWFLTTGVERKVFQLDGEKHIFVVSSETSFK
jgi:uncharacterized membrane protein